jgi:regulator of cell morphogenesis and NO signaling
MSASFSHIDFNAIREEDLIIFFEQRHHAHAINLLELILKNFDSALHQEHTLHEGAEYLLNLLLDLRKQVEKIFAIEQESIFPFVRTMLEIRAHKTPVRFLNINLSESSIRAIRLEHSRVLDLLHSIRQFTHNYTPPVRCNETLKLVYAELEEFDRDFGQLLHREIEFLFPRIIALEQEVMRRTDEAARENGHFRSGIE